MISPLEHFELNFFFKIPLIALSLSNYLFYFFSFSLFLFLIRFVVFSNDLVPSRSQIILEDIFYFILLIIRQQIKSFRFLKLFPLFFFFFLSILLLNVSSLVSFNVAITGHLIATLTLVFGSFISLVIIGFLNFRMDFFKLFQPSSVPPSLFPIFVVIEILSFLIRPFSLSIRLFANMLSGHTLMNIFAAFGLFVLKGYLLFFYFPLLLIFFIIVLEICVAIIQAYVFIILLLIYFNDVYSNMGSH